jgi:hypothetical protein
MNRTSPKGSTITKILVVIALLGMAYTNKNAQGVRYTDVALQSLEVWRESMLDKARSAKDTMQSHEDATQKMIDEN